MKYPLWIAHYYADSPGVQRNWTFWQHNDRGHVNGIDGYVDFDTFSGDSMAFEQMRYKGKPVIK
ncbi:GH25 family lysozyme [Chitinophagaceae bacterium MMS25-I14]